MFERRRARAVLAAFAGLLLAGAAAAEETRITVRVLSKGAKFVGTSMGGVRVTLHDTETGQLLAQGVTAGSTGDTARIMRDPHPRWTPLATPGSAAFEAVLDLDEPRHVRVTAYGPLAQRQSASEASATLWLIPGRHLTGGDGVLLELPGFAVDVLAPAAHSRHALPAEVEIRANVTMM